MSLRDDDEDDEESESEEEEEESEEEESDDEEEDDEEDEEKEAKDDEEAEVPPIQVADIRTAMSFVTCGKNTCKVQELHQILQGLDINITKIRATYFFTMLDAENTGEVAWNKLYYALRDGQTTFVGMPMKDIIGGLLMEFENSPRGRNAKAQRAKLSFMALETSTGLPSKQELEAIKKKEELKKQEELKKNSLTVPSKTSNNNNNTNNTSKATKSNTSNKNNINKKVKPEPNKTKTIQKESVNNNNMNKVKHNNLHSSMEHKKTHTPTKTSAAFEIQDIFEQGTGRKRRRSSLLHLRGLSNTSGSSRSHNRRNSSVLFSDKLVSKINNNDDVRLGSNYGSLKDILSRYQLSLNKLYSSIKSVSVSMNKPYGTSQDLLNGINNIIILKKRY